MRKILHVDSLPDLRKNGLSQAVETDDFVFAATMAISYDTPYRRVEEAVTIADETRICLERMEKKLNAGGCSLKDVVKMTCYLADRSYQAEFKEVYKTYWEEGTAPLRCTFFVGIATDCRMELDAIAVKPKK